LSLSGSEHGLLMLSEKIFFIKFHIINRFPLFLRFFSEFFKTIFFKINCLFKNFEIRFPIIFNFLKVRFMSIQYIIVTAISLLASWIDLLAGVPANRVHVFDVNSGVKLSWASFFSSALLPELIRAIAKHHSFVVAY
jgi:hypothetical protein